MKNIILSLALLSFGTTAEAALPKLPKSFCVSGEKLSDQMQNCVENQKFIDAAENCLEKLEKAIANQTTALTASLKTPKGDQQNKNFSTSASDYATTSANLGYLISLADLAATETAAYLEWMLIPEHADDPAANQGDPEGYMEAHPCFSETRDALNDILDDIEHHQAELEEAKDASDAKAGISSSHSGSLSNTGPAAPIVKSGKDQKLPTQARPKGKDPRTSDISGTEDKKDKK